jgi:hypothetical protein
VRSAIHAHVPPLRQVLAQVNAAEDSRPPGQLLHQGNGYVLQVDPQWVDLHSLRRLARTARQCADGERAELLRQVLDSWRMPALATSPGDWPARMRERWDWSGWTWRWTGPAPNCA